jgi:hypothetical protein
MFSFVASIELASAVHVSVSLCYQLFDFHFETLKYSVSLNDSVVSIVSFCCTKVFTSFNIRLY